MLAKLVAISAFLVAGPVIAGTCEENFKVEGDVSAGASYASAVVVPNVSISSAVGQLRNIAVADGFNVISQETGVSNGKLTIEQVRGSRPFPIFLTVSGSGTSSLLVIQTRLNRGATARPEDMRQAMCGMLARVQGTSPLTSGSQAQTAAAASSQATPTRHTPIAGRSTITGQAFAKVALLAPKQFPPRGTPVGIIPLTDAVRQWIASTRNGTATGYPPEIRNLVSYVLIEDNRGTFRFNNLPVGEYIVHVSLGYRGNRSVSRYEGTDVVTDARSGAVVSSYDRVGQYTINEARGAVIEKNVVIRSDGETVTVELSKSDVFAEGSIFNPR
jgi:hypothetical protein